MSSHLKHGGTTWWHFKYAQWMLTAGVFTGKQLADQFGVDRKYVWELLTMVVDSGFLEKVDPPSSRGRPTYYRVVKE